MRRTRGASYLLDGGQGSLQERSESKYSRVSGILVWPSNDS
jgi:hypothetical protein